MIQLHRNIWLLQIIHFLYGLIFFAPYFMVMLKDKLDSAFIASTLLATQSILTTLLEIPSGLFSDRFGRRKTCILGSSFMAAGLLFFYFGSTIWILIFYAIFNAIGLSLWSGIDSSLLYESNPEDFKKELSRYESVWSLGMCISSTIAFFLVNHSYDILILFTLIAFMLAFICTFFIIEPNTHQKKGKLTSHIKSATNHIRKTPTLFFLIILSLLYYASAESIHYLNSLFFEEKKIALKFFAILAIGIFGFSFLGYRMSNTISNFIGNKTTLHFSTLSAIGTLLLATQAEGLMAGILLISGSFFWGLRQPILSHYMHQLAHDDMRATIISIGNCGSEIGFAIAILIFGQLTDIFTTTVTFIIISLLYIPIIAILLLINFDTPSNVISSKSQAKMNSLDPTHLSN